jgi:hypothetical protein
MAEADAAPVAEHVAFGTFQVPVTFLKVVEGLAVESVEPSPVAT